MMEGALGRRTPPAEAEGGGGGGMSSPHRLRFTPLELAAAEQLIHLSESSSSAGAAAAFTPRRRPGGSAASVSSSLSSSSPRSVNNAPTRGLGLGEVDEDDGDEQEVGGRPRRNRRIRPIAEIYSATAPIGGRGGGGRKDKGKAGATE